MGEKEDDNNFKENIKIYANSDERMRDLGNILSTPKSRTIYQILTKCELNAKEIGKLLDHDENPRLPNLIYHLDKMVKIGILSVKKRQQRKHGHVLKYYKAVSIIIIVSEEHYEKATTSKTFLNALKKVFKFSVLGIMFFISQPFFKYVRGLSPIIMG